MPVVCGACGETEAGDKQRSEGLMSDEGPAAFKWAKFCRLPASGCMSDADELEVAEKRENAKTGRKKIEAK
jgi:hypothetical protein